MAYRFRVDLGTGEAALSTESARFAGVENRRAYERVPFFCEVRVSVRSQRPAIAAHTCDISRGGVKLASPVVLRPGTEVLLEFALNEGEGAPPEKVFGRVVRCDADVDANYVGIEFSERLSEIETPSLWQRLVNI
jgi:hypothetical protein